MGKTAEPPSDAAPLENATRAVVVWGPNGSPGKSTLALNLADALARQGQRVLLLDTDLVSPSLAVQLGVEDQASGISAACKLAREANLDAAQLQRIVVKVSAGSTSFALLPGITGASRW
ncbi:MAG: hypothetical protein RL719_144, partial [Actinomycetota bacterium]